MAVSETFTERLDTTLITEGFDPECVRWVCAEHHRHCGLIGCDPHPHRCYWCDRE